MLCGPGVTVTLVNPGTIGGNQEAVTSERGTYQFTRLVPGRYSVTAALPGFRPAVQDDVAHATFGEQNGGPRTDRPPADHHYVGATGSGHTTRP